MQPLFLWLISCDEKELLHFRDFISDFFTNQRKCVCAWPLAISYFEFRLISKDIARKGTLSASTFILISDPFFIIFCRLLLFETNLYNIEKIGTVTASSNNAILDEFSEQHLHQSTKKISILNAQFAPLWWKFNAFLDWVALT